jgi:VWFA-related protein
MSVRLAVIAGALAATALATSAAPPQSFRSGVQTVAVYATVSDRNGRLVPNLQREDFRIFDNGRQVDITNFSNELQPITVAVMLDMSGSMVRRFLKLRAATNHFIDALLPWDRARIGSFGVEIAVSPLLTGDKDLLKRVVREELWPGGGTPLWNGIDAAMRSLEGEQGRRVVLVFTDGLDTGSLEGLDGAHGNVERRARDQGFMLYAIGMNPPGLAGDLAGLTEDTGGGHFEMNDGDDLTATFSKVADELRHQYVLGFTPRVLDGKQHKLDVRVTRGMKARARKNYLAVPQ